MEVWRIFEIQTEEALNFNNDKVYYLFPRDPTNLVGVKLAHQVFQDFADFSTFSFSSFSPQRLTLLCRGASSSPFKPLLCIRPSPFPTMRGKSSVELYC
jgi:hypothetical protein